MPSTGRDVVKMRAWYSSYSKTLHALQNRRAPIRVQVATSGSHWLANSIIRSIMAFCLHELIADTFLFNTKWLCYFKYFMVCLCWGLTSQSTIFQSCRDGATASWVINQYFRGVKYLAQGHNTAAVGFEPPTSRSEIFYGDIRIIYREIIGSL